MKSAKKANVVYIVVNPVRPGSSGSLDTNPATMSSGGILSPVRATPMEAASSGGVVTVSLVSLANETGGTFIDNIMDYDAELDRLDRQISNYYVLGFQSNNPKHDGSFRKIEIKTDVKGVTLKHRIGYQDRSPIDVLAGSKQEKVLLSAVATPGVPEKLPIVFRPMYFYDSPQAARVLVAARIRMQGIAFKKKGSQMTANLNLMGVAYGEDGSIAARFSETLPVRFEQEKEEEFRRRDLPYQNYFRLRPGAYRLKLAVTDESNSLGAAEQVFQIPVLPEGKFSGSSIVVAEQTFRVPDLIQNLQMEMMDDSDPLVYSGMRIEPSVENRIPLSSAITVLFRIYNVPGNPDQWNLTAKARLIDHQGQELALDPIAMGKSTYPLGRGIAAVGLTLPFRSMEAGKYRLSIQITETNTSSSTTLQSDLEYAAVAQSGPR